MGTDLSPENEQFVEESVAAGTFPSRRDVLDQGVELVRQRHELLSRVGESRRQLDSGEFTEYDDDGLRDLFEDIKTKAKGAGNGA
jgi:Arc/MetJ-type ribon-helix-helix transcriptional regulator